MMLWFYQEGERFADEDEALSTYESIKEIFDEYVGYDYRTIEGLEVTENGTKLFCIMRNLDGTWPVEMDLDKLIAPKLPSIRPKSIIEI